MVSVVRTTAAPHYNMVAAVGYTETILLLEAHAEISAFWEQ